METPSQLEEQVYVMNFPSTLSTDSPNNIWMDELKESGKLKVNKEKFNNQWMDLYTFLSSSSLVYLLPNSKPFQDITYVANMGIYLPHYKEENVIILSNFTSEPRIGEEEVGRPFFEALGYKAIKSPYKFEGEADLKYLKDNIYIGGWGIRTKPETYDWMEKEFNMKVLDLEMVDDYLYHLDCTVFPLTREDVMICTEMYEKNELKKIEKYAEIIDVNVDDALGGICNIVRMDNMVVVGSNITELKTHDEDYKYEKNKINNLELICGDYGLELMVVNLSELQKSGACLSCLVLTLNRHNLYPLI